MPGMLRIPDIETLEKMAQETEARIQEANNADGKFCPTSLEDWLELCQRTGVPHVPARKVTELRREDYLSFDTQGDHSQRLKAAGQEIQAARKRDHMMRLDCCSDAEIKYRMAQGEPDFREEFDHILFGDPRAFDLVAEHPRDILPVWQRPWQDTMRVDGYPVEYRAFVRDGRVRGISSYYPQRPLPEFPEHLRAVALMTGRLAAALEGPFLWNNTGMLLHLELDPRGVHFTADFLVTPQEEVLSLVTPQEEVIFLEGGPPHELGAHMCCFRPGEIEGIALTDRNTD